MSRVGKQPINIPEGVKVELSGKLVKVDGPKGSLEQSIVSGFEITEADNTITIKPKTDNKEAMKFWGLTRTLINNMIVGVSAGFEKNLEINGVGYRAQMQGSNLVLNLGFSHQITVNPPEGITLEVQNNTQIKVSGYDKQKVGSVAAHIRSLKKPEPYKGKGIKYVDEHIRRKAGKTAAKGAA